MRRYRFGHAGGKRNLRQNLSACLSVLLIIPVLYLEGCGPVDETGKEAEGAFLPDILYYLPAANYFELQVCKPAEKYRSELFTQLCLISEAARKARSEAEGRSRRLGFEFDKYGLEMKLVSASPREDADYIEGYFTDRHVEDYYLEDRETAKLEQQNIGGHLFREDETGLGYVLTPEGVLFARREIVEATFGDYRTEGEKLFVSELFFNALGLVDFEAAEYRLRWANMAPVRVEWKTAIGPKAGEEVLAAVETLEAVGRSQFWGKDYRSDVKLMFQPGSAAQTFGQYLEDKFEEVSDKLLGESAAWLSTLFKLEKDGLDQLDKRLTVSTAGNVVTVAFYLTLDDYSSAVERYAGLEKPDKQQPSAEKAELLGENVIVVRSRGGTAGYGVTVLDAWGNCKDWSSTEIGGLASYLSGLYSALRSQRPNDWYDLPIYILVSREAPWSGFTDVWGEIEELEKGLLEFFPESVPPSDRKLRTLIPEVEEATRMIEELRSQGRIY